MVKSTCDSVAFPRHGQNPVEVVGGGVKLELANDIAKHVSAASTRGRDWRRHMSKLSEKAIKFPVSSYTLNCFRKTKATTSRGNAAKTVLYRMYNFPKLPGISTFSEIFILELQVGSVQN